MQKLHCYLFLLLLLCCSFPLHQARKNSNGRLPYNNYLGGIGGGLQYHMGSVLSSPINLYLIWYGQWEKIHQEIIRDFLNSLSSPFPPPPPPSVADWWKTVRLYTDQTGSNVTGSVTLAGEFLDLYHSHGVRLKRLDIQYIIGAAIARGALPLDAKNGFYLVLTSPEVGVQDFCVAACGFHSFAFPSAVGAVIPFAWVGNSGAQCSGVCAYPFARPEGSPPLGHNNYPAMGAPNGDAGVDGMVSVIAHELAEASSDPFASGWYAGTDATAPTEIGDMCEGIYGMGGGSGYVGEVERDKEGRVYNLNGVKGRRFLVQWVYNPYKGCDGPNYK